MGLTHPGTGRGMRSRMIGSRKTVPPRMLRICARCSATSDAKRSDENDAMHTVPLGERHICLSLNSFTRASSGVMVAHLIPTLYLRIASADSIVTWSLVYVGSKEGGSIAGRNVETRGKWPSRSVRSPHGHAVTGMNDVLHRGTRGRDQST